MGHLKGQPPPPQTMFSKEKQPQHGRGANKMPTVNSLRVALAEGEKRLSVREVKSIFSRILCFTMREVKELAVNKTLPIILTGFAKAMLSEYEKGERPYTVFLLMDLAFGKVGKKQSVEPMTITIEQMNDGSIIIEIQ